jgi:hypothetical protein
MTEGRHLDFHEWIKRKRVQDFMEFRGTFDVEDADIRILSGHPPER